MSKKTKLIISMWEHLLASWSYELKCDFIWDVFKHLYMKMWSTCPTQQYIWYVLRKNNLLLNIK